jgi:DNA-binding transcriptional LysR family regulator
MSVRQAQVQEDLTPDREAGLMNVMELRLLRYFVAVAEEQHFGRAATRLHMAQPGLSHQIRRLEHDLGAELFLRTTRRVELTDAGRILLGDARQILAHADRASAAVAQAVQGEVGLVRIGFVSSAALATTPRLAHALHARAPGLKLQLDELTTETQLDLLRDGGLDVGLVREVAAAPGLVVQPLLRERLYVALHHSHRLAAHRSVALEQLAGEPFIVFPRERVSLLYDHIAGLCQAAGFTLSAAQEAVQFITILGLVAGNAGVAIVPEPLRALQLPGLRYLPLEDEAAASLVSIAYRPGVRSPAVQKVLATATAVFAGEAA